MPIEWRRWVEDAGWQASDREILVPLDNARKQRVFVEEEAGTGGSIRLWSVAARPSNLPPGKSPHLFAWLRNRESDLVGFKIDRKGRMIGEVWLPLVGLDAREVRTSIQALARGCDRIEWLLTGKDSS